MDFFPGAFSGSTIASDCDNESVSTYLDLEFIDGVGFEDNSVLYDGMDFPTTSNFQYPIISNRLESVDTDSAVEKGVSNAVLRYIDQVLMENNLDDKAFTIQDSTLDAAEKSLYEILHKDPSCSSSSPNLPSETQTGWQSIEETIKGLPCRNLEASDYGYNGLTTSGAKEKMLTVHPNPENEEGKLLDSISRRRKSLHREENDLQEGRNKKHFTLSAEEAVLNDMFDRVLSLYRDALPNGVSVESLQKQGAKGSDHDELAYSRKGVRKREAIDMRNLLLQCMQSVANDDHGSATFLLKQIRASSSPLGDGSQRLAHYFANGLEARLAGSRNMEYKSLTTKMSDASALKAYKLYLLAFPFMETTYFFANEVILELSNKATAPTLHIISFITIGFQWPYLIQRLSARPGGPPKLRVTGIELPQEGLRMASMVKETLANCCEKFNVPFEYNGVAKNLETICVEDLRIQKDEVIVVNCLYQSMFIPDDFTSHVSPRNAFLNLIKMINPDIFLHAIVNGDFNSPFFVSRFREALFHFSALFDMVEANLTREDQDRMVFEREVLGNSFLNVIACEGVGRIVRPETYKQWQIRTLRAGFRQLPLKQEIINEAKAKVKLCYHKGFFVKVDSGWMLTGWKGRVMFACSCWKPVEDSCKFAY